MKHLLVLLLVPCSVSVFAQDVIVKKDGSTILSKVLEVNTADIKYKKYSNRNGPTYSISKAEIMAINYENDDKDTFEETGNVDLGKQTNTSSAPSINYATLAEENLPIVREYNSHDVVYLKNDTVKEADALINTFGIKEGSIIETPDLKASFSMKKKFMEYTSNGRMKSSRIAEISDRSRVSEGSWLDMIVVNLKNKTNKTIYIDLGTSYVITGKESTPYYIPTAESISSSNTSGGSVNMGAVAGALGIDGALVTLAGGVNVGGASSTIANTTRFSQRVISVPPMASITLEPQSIGRGCISQPPGWVDRGITKYYNDIELPYSKYFNNNGRIIKKKNCDEIHFDGLKRGEKINIPQMDDVTPLSVHISYAFDEAISQPLNMRIDFYWRQVLGINLRVLFQGNLKSVVDYQECPLIFSSGNPIRVYR